MFHFPSFPPHCLCVQQRVTAHDDCRVSPFGNPRIKAWLTAPRGLSWPPTSFIGSWCQGIHRAPLKTWPQMLASTVQFSNNDRPPVTHRSRDAAPGPASEGVHSLRHPTACPTGPRPGIMLSTLRRAVLAGPRPETTGRIINVPPMSNQHRTCAGVLAPGPPACRRPRSAP